MDKVVIVTGGAKGIGRAVSELFVKEGATVVVCDKSEKGQYFVDNLNERGNNSLFIKAEITNEQEVIDIVKMTVNTYGSLDIMVANAGIAETIPIHELSSEIWQKTLDVNLTGVFLTNKYAIEQMLKQGRGVIVNTASMLGLIGRQNVTSYTASKGGVVNLTRTLGVTYAKHGIRVNAVCPGYIETDLIRNKPKEVLEELVGHHPIGRLGKEEEIAKAILFLASDDASFICGSNLVIDGGFSAQ